MCKLTGRVRAQPELLPAPWVPLVSPLLWERVGRHSREVDDKSSPDWVPSSTWPFLALCRSVCFLLTTPGHTHCTFQDDYTAHRESPTPRLPLLCTWMWRASWTVLAVHGQCVLASVIIWTRTLKLTEGRCVAWRSHSQRGSELTFEFRLPSPTFCPTQHMGRQVSV